MDKRKVWLGAGCIVLISFLGGLAWRINHTHTSEQEPYREKITLSAGEDKAVASPSKSSGPAPGFTNSLGMAFVYIKPGTFMMGSPESEDKLNDDETQHEVRLTQGYYMGITEVTVGQFRMFVNATGYKSEAETDGGAGGVGGFKTDLYWNHPGFEQTDLHPVTCVSWNDAQIFIEWLNRRDHRQYRLPTEAEWEYAARAGSSAARYWGNDPDLACEYANVADKTAAKELSWHGVHDCEDGYTYSSPVGNFGPNRFGLYDMIGNVWEWCQDLYGFYPKGSVSDPLRSSGPTMLGGRILRGGSWMDDSWNSRSAMRNAYAPDWRQVNRGFRLAASQLDGNGGCGLQNISESLFRKIWAKLD